MINLALTAAAIAAVGAAGIMAIADDGVTARVIASGVAGLIGAAILMARYSDKNTAKRTANGFVFPTSLEAQWAQTLDRMGIRWSYQRKTLCGGNHHWEITMPDGGLACAVTANADAMPAKIRQRLERSKCRRGKIILSSYADTGQGPIGWLQTEPGREWETLTPEPETEQPPEPA